MKLYQAGVPGDSVGYRRFIEESGITNLLVSFHLKQAQAAGVFFIELANRMRLYQAGSFAGSNQRTMLYSVGPQSVLFSFAHKTARDTLGLVVGPEGQEKMKLYLAGDWSPEMHAKVCEDAGEKNLLCTNAARSSRARADYFAKKPGYRILVDSGAFTAWKQGTAIVLDDYIAYAKQLRSTITEGTTIEFIGLDVIAGTPEQGKAGTIPAADLVKACEDGYHNFEIMREAGVECLPTFHRDDDFKWLRKIADKAERFCLAPRVDGSPTYVKMRWLNECFKYLGPSAWKEHRIHGLGISSIEMMETYPFYSVDSTGWLWAAVNTTHKWFDGTYMRTCQKTAAGGKQNWHVSHRATGDRSIRHAAPRTVQAVDKYRTQEQGSENGLVGGYWSGAQAIVADVRLENHVSHVWSDRGVSWSD